MFSSHVNATFPRLRQLQLSSPTQASTTWCFFRTFGWDLIMKRFEQHCQRWWVHSSSGKIVFCINLQNRVMTRVGDLAPALCDGRVLPTSCSGLALVSRCLKGLYHFRSILFADMLSPWLKFWEKENWSRKHLQVPYPWDWVQGFLRARFGFK